MEKKKTAVEFNDDWTWHSMVYKICQELNYNPDQVYNLLILDCLNWLAFFKEADDYKQKLKDAAEGISRY